jgi:hypothetical protein
LIRFEGIASFERAKWQRDSAKSSILIVDANSVSISLPARLPFPQKIIILYFRDGIEFARQRANGNPWLGVHRVAQREWTWFKTSESDALADVLHAAGAKEVPPPRLQLAEDLFPVTLLGAGALTTVGAIIAATSIVFRTEIDSATISLLGSNRPYGSISVMLVFYGGILVVLGIALLGIHVTFRILRAASSAQTQ